MDKDQILRYSRQIILEPFGLEGQKRLLSSKVLVIGAGGLGSPVLLYLAAAGVGTLGIADFDTVGLSNLNRQILHFTEDIGQKKAASAAVKLTKLNPDIRVITHTGRITIDNIESIIQAYDLVIDATDNFPARYLVSDACYFAKKPVIEGAVLGFEGILMTIIPGTSPCYRCLYPVPPQDGVVPTCNDAGILGAIAGTIGSLQALEAVKVLLGIGETLSGRILIFDGLGLNFRQVPWAKRKNCPLCGETPSIHELRAYTIQCQAKRVE